SVTAMFKQLRRAEVAICSDHQSTRGERFHQDVFETRVNRGVNQRCCLGHVRYGICGCTQKCNPLTYVEFGTLSAEGVPQWAITDDRQPSVCAVQIFRESGDGRCKVFLLY